MWSEEEGAVTVLAATWGVLTPCHRRRVFLDERELEGPGRSVTFPCPRCSRIWVASIPMPVVTWTR
jgi:hypothetical protein